MMDEKIRRSPPPRSPRSSHARPPGLPRRAAGYRIGAPTRAGKVWQSRGSLVKQAGLVFSPCPYAPPLVQVHLDSKEPCPARSARALPSLFPFSEGPFVNFV